MSREKQIRIGQYTYVLPGSRIARYPLPERDSSKLLVYRDGEVSDDVFKNLPDHIGNEYQLVFNNTKVIRARLRFRKETGALIEIFCLEPFSPSDHVLSFASTAPVNWRCLVGNYKKWKSGSLEMEISSMPESITLSADVISDENGEVIVRFSWNSDLYCFSEVLELSGNIPVPPYLNRKEEEIDNLRYQTVYSRNNGSVAAPTAGLHFTDQILERLKNRGIDLHEITLHVGAGTFVPVKTDTIGEHTMHSEHFIVQRESLAGLLKKKIISVGTTTLRTLESIYWLGVKIIRGEIVSPLDMSVDQWYPYQEIASIEADEALAALNDFMAINNLDVLEAKTSIIIVPGYRFKLVNGLITNFHMPGSTLLLLVAAIAGDNWKKIYHHALDNNYRFLSYGDSSILLP